MEYAEKDFFGLIFPRPVVCISTYGKDGSYNIAPYSFVTPLSFNPPLLAFSVGKKKNPKDASSEQKDTLRNILETKEFVVVPVHEPWVEEAIRTEAALPYGESEFDYVGLTPTPSKQVGAPSVAEAMINIECTVESTVDAGDHVLVIGKVVHIGAEKVTDKNVEKLGFLGFINGENFILTHDILSIHREQ
ncbi:MAG: flavin reductase family protein [Methermicoccaceae archaeon]